jgi:hypothetical protein
MGIVIVVDGVDNVDRVLYPPYVDEERPVMLGCSGDSP